MNNNAGELLTGREVSADGHGDDELGVDPDNPALRKEADKVMAKLHVKEAANGDIGQVGIDEVRREVEKLVARAIRDKEERERAMALARVDSLTELPNRRALMETLAIELGKSVRYGEPVSVLIVDIDHFKNVNDTLGHAGGDAVLKDIADLFKMRLRHMTGDVIGRYGGEEFICIAPRANGAAALIAERLRLGVETLFKTDPAYRGVPITISIGVATFYSDLHNTANRQEDLINRADAALYKAKEGGRNQVWVLNEREALKPFKLTPEKLIELRRKYGGYK